MKRQRIPFAVLFAIAASAVLASAQTPSNRAAVTLDPAFELRVFARVIRPVAIAIPPDDSVFGQDLFVASNPGAQRRVDFISRVTPAGAVVPFAVLVAEADPVDLTFGRPGTRLDGFLFVAASNRDGDRPGDHGGCILRIGPDGMTDDFTPIGIQPAGKPPGPGEPMGIAFGHGGAFGSRLYVANSYDVPADILRVGPDGDVDPFVDDGRLRGGLAPSDVAFSPDGKALFFTDAHSFCVRSADAAGRVGHPLVRLPALGPRHLARGLTFGPGGRFGTDLYVTAGGTLYRVGPKGELALFATGFSTLSAGALAFDREGDSLFIADATAGCIYRIRPRETGGVETVTIRGHVTDQFGDPVKNVPLRFLGGPNVRTGDGGVFKVALARATGQTPSRSAVLMTDLSTPGRYADKLTSMALTAGDNRIDLAVNLAPATDVVGGQRFTYFDQKIRGYLHDGEQYEIGDYSGSDTRSFAYLGQGAMKHRYGFRDPGVTACNRNLRYKGGCYAPVRIYRQDTGTTLGHLFIDRTGRLVAGPEAGETLLALYAGMHAFGTPSARRLDDELRFYKQLRALVRNMAGAFDRVVETGIALKTLDTGTGLYLNVSSGDPAGAAAVNITARSSAHFFDRLYRQAGLTAKRSPATLDSTRKRIEWIKLAKTTAGAQPLVTQLWQLRNLSGHTTDVDTLLPLGRALTPGRLAGALEELEQNLEDQPGLAVRRSYVRFALDTLWLVEKSSRSTRRAVTRRLQATATLALLNRIIETVDGVRRGIDDATEAEEVLNLKYVCASMTYLCGTLLQDVVGDPALRAHYTVPENIYRGLRTAAARIDNLPEHPNAGARHIASLFLGDGSSTKPGMAYHQLLGYYFDLDLAVAQTKWTLARTRELAPPEM